MAAAFCHGEMPKETQAFSGENHGPNQTLFSSTKADPASSMREGLTLWSNFH